MVKKNEIFIDSENEKSAKMRQSLELMRWGVKRLFVGAAFLCLAAFSAADGPRMSIQQVWSGLGSAQTNPYYVNIDNQGQNENAVIYTTSDREAVNIEYPIELPSGSKKRVMFQMGGYGDGRVFLRTSSGIKESPIKVNYVSEQSRVGLISDNPSDLIFLKGQSGSGNDNNAIGVGGCTPEDAPDRYMGYECLDALVLADGTERLRDEQIEAIKQYLRSGGVVLFVGGASPSASSDPRWRDVLPVSSATVTTQSGLTERIGKPSPNSRKIDVQRGVSYLKSYGIGLASYLSVNPFESPIREYEDRRSLVNKALNRGYHIRVRQMLQSQVGDGNEYDPYGATYGSPVAVAAPATTTTSGSGPSIVKPKPIQTDPFQIKPPAVSSIMWILIAYAVLVVPINFLVLRKLNRLELAWVTAPIISVVFSAILLNSTIGLYKASATTRTTAIAAFEDQNGEAMVFGRSEMFFPRAKSYDLGLKGVQSVATEYRYGAAGSSGINLIDNGREISAPAVNTGNLAFKDLQYVQESNELNGLRFSLKEQGGRKILVVQNQSHIDLASVMLFGPGKNKTLDKAVKSGGSVEVDVSDLIRSKLPASNDQNYSWQTISESLPNRLIAYAVAAPMHVGPKYGEGHPSSIYSLVTAPNLEVIR